MALNLCYDKLRRKREVLVKELPEQMDEAPNPAETLQRSQVAQRVDQAVSELSSEKNWMNWGNNYITRLSPIVVPLSGFRDHREYGFIARGYQSI